MSRRPRVPVERIRPLVQWLIRTYPTTQDAADASGVSYSVLNHILYDNRYNYVSVDSARSITEFVLAHRRTVAPFGGDFENEHSPRFATQEEQATLKHRRGISA